jgi:hypothetical protein
MPNEIYHRSNFGNPNAEGFGDVYYDHAATNKLYNHSDYYENSDGTDATLKDLNNKASIVLTPTAYSDGSLNTVIPPYAPSYIENVPFVTSEWASLNEGWSIDETNNKLVAEATWTGANKNAQYNISEIRVGKTVKVSFDIVITAGELNMYRPFSKVVTTSGSYSFTGVAASNNILRFRNRTTDFAGEITNIRVEVIEEADFDFSRGSSATRVNEQGLVEDVQILSGELVQNGNFEQIGSELVTNGNFETDSDWIKETGWSISDGKANKTSTVASNFAQLNTGVFTNNNTYKITFNISNSNDGRLLIYIGGNSVTIDITNTTNGTHTFYAKADGQDYLIFRNDTSGFQGSIDNVSIKEVGQNWTISGDNFSIVDSALRINRVTNTTFIQQNVLTSGKKYKVEFDVLDKADNSGNFTVRLGSNNVYSVSDYEGTKFSKILTSSGTDFRIYSSSNNGVIYVDNVSVKEITDDTDLPRIDFTDGTGSLLLEPQRTNLLTYSEDFSQWSSGGVTITPNSTISPDGTQNASLFSHSGGSFPQIALSGITFVSSADYAPSLYVKSDGTTQVQHSLIVNGQVVNFTPTNEWVRVSDLIVSPDTSGSFVIAQNSGSAVSASFYIWGAQLEQGSYPTSYIPTSGSTVTRSADVANNSGNADLFNDSEGVLYAQFTALADDNTSRTVSINNTSSNRVFLSLRATTGQVNSGVVVGGALQGSAMSYSVSQTSDIKLAIKYKQNDFSLFVNGTQASTSSGNVFSSGTLNDLSFDSGSGAEDFFGKVKCVAVFKEALSNDLLERLTGEGFESFRLLAEANNYTII